jgi:hypothetical protein
MSMTGGITVAGVVTGTHIIEDIRVAVPHKMAVYIPAEQALRSKDLHRALQQGLLFKLDGGSGLRSDDQPPPEAQPSGTTRFISLEQENKRLMRELDEAHRREEGLKQAISALQEQLGAILKVLGRIEARPDPAPVVVQAGGTVVPLPEVVGGDTPSFIPDEILPKDAETNIRVQKGTAEGSAVIGAASRLRELRRSKGTA